MRERQQIETRLRVYAKAKGSEPAGPFFSSSTSHSFPHFRDRDTGTGLPGTDTWVSLYPQGPQMLKTVSMKNSLLSLTETSENNY